MKTTVGTYNVCVSTTGYKVFQVKPDSPFYNKRWPCDNARGAPGGTYQEFMTVAEKATGAFEVDQGPYWDAFVFSFDSDTSQVEAKKKCREFIQEHFIEITSEQLDQWREQYR
jgi:hypothetical protein